MKILVLGLDCAAPELLFGYEDLPNIRRLMEVGATDGSRALFPRLPFPPGCAWQPARTRARWESMVFATAATIPIGAGYASARSITEPAIWDHLAREGKRSIIVGVPPGYPPRRINGLALAVS